MYTLHVLPNAHLDPVWLWDGREGLNQGIRSMRATVSLMDEFPELTYMRGEAMLYRHLEEFDPETFRRVRELIEAGRWDVIGGTVIQPDTNLPSAETLVRHYAMGLEYFRTHLGVRPTAAWAADSFGHTAGMPEVLAAAGMTDFSFTRPFPQTVSTAKPAFWWKAASGASILCYRPEIGWYGTNRAEVLPRLDETLAKAGSWGVENIALYLGLGDHGGGPTRRQILDVRDWAARHPEVRVVFGGLHSFFRALRAEAAAHGGNDYFPTVEGELNFTLRGCYTSVARHKFLFRKTESALAASERVDTLVRTALCQKAVPQPDAWRGLLFNTFHDILPGTSHERAHIEQLRWLGGVYHTAQKQSMGALNALAYAVDTTVPRPPNGDFPEVLPFVVFNPHPWDYRGLLELEGCMDDRPGYYDPYGKGQAPLEVRDPAGRRIPFQIAAAEAPTGDVNWRSRAIFQAKIPAFGWAVYTFGWVQGSTMKTIATEVASPRRNTITNGIFTVSATMGAAGIRILRDGRPWLRGKGIQAQVFRDAMGSWGSDAPLQYDPSVEPETWTVDQIEVVESGPIRASLFVRLAGKRSWLALTFRLVQGREAVDVDARLLWNERAARLKLVFPAGARQADYAVPGAVVRRDAALGEVPGGAWVRALDDKTAPVLGFASDAIYGFDIDARSGALRASVARASGYSFSAPRGEPLATWRPSTDNGEHLFRFVLAPGDAPLARLAAELEQPPLDEMAPCSSPGKLPRTGSLLTLAPTSLQILALKPAEDGSGDVVLRVRETSGSPVKATCAWFGGATMSLGKVPGNGIATWRMKGLGTETPVIRAVDAGER